jgi:L-fuculose-phosphate aldolase
MSEAAREQLVEAAQTLHSGGLNLGTAGNLSVRSADGMLVTPSARSYATMTPEDIVFVGADGRAQGKHPPSSEWRFHLAIYQRFPKAGAVVHTHSTHATALACLGRGIPALHYEVALAGGHDIRCASYATFGGQALSEHVVAALEDRRACLIAHHGLVTHGADLPGALTLAQKVEQLAHMVLLCLQAGQEPSLLDEAEMMRVAEQFRRYHAGEAIH